ncbi:MAG: alanine dehydrogenase, partial [Mariprofundus sp.]
MRIGVPREIKNHEHRIAITPAGCALLIGDGHDVCVQTGAGLDSGFADDTYVEAGARIAQKADEIWDCDMVVKVKEPQLCEYAFLRPELILFTFLHLAADPALAKVLLDRKVCAIAYETVQLEDGRLPILAQMSNVAGRVAIQLAVRFLQKENGTSFQGKGHLAGGVDGVAAANVVILGAGNVG